MGHDHQDLGQTAGNDSWKETDDTAPTTVTTNSIDEKIDKESLSGRNLGDTEKPTGHLELIKTREELPPDELEKQETVYSIHHPKSHPDGGLSAWLCVAGGFFATFCSFGFINCVGVFQAYYQEHQLSEYSPSTISWISSLQVFCMFVPGPIVGKIFDSHGPARLLIVGTLLQVFGLMMVSISKEYWHFLLTQGLLTGFGGGFIFNPTMSCVMTWFFHRRAFAAGIVAAGSSIGGLIFPIMIPRLIRSVGFGWALRITAFFILALMMIVNFTVRSRLPPKGPGASSWHYNQFIKNFKEAPFSLTVTACFLFFFSMFIPVNYLPVFARHHGMSEQLANYLVSILNGVSFFGRVLPSYMADKVGRYNYAYTGIVYQTIVGVALLCSILILGLWIPAAGNAPIIVFAALYGFTMGAFVSVGPSLMAQISDVREIGVRSGTMFSCIAFGALIGNPIGGALVTRYKGEYTGLQILAGVIMLGSCVVFGMARWSIVGNKLRTKV